MTTTAEMPQHLQALERANRTRLARAELKRQICSGEVAVTDVLSPTRAIPWEAQSMGIAQLLAAQHRWGARRARRLLCSLNISERRPVGNLTPRQRGLLVRALGGEKILAA